MNKLSELRATFLDFFAKEAHAVLPSAPLIPQSDPTLMFTNAGMVPFKHVFAGKQVLKNEAGHPIARAASSQKCVRAGGKHNDLDNVGYTARHHTFFEMLGNFSFGDYFKEEAIAYAWEFLTKTLSLPEEKLYVTIYHTDDEAFDLWKKISGLGEEKIIRIPTQDNFWAMGDTGPCGPCSEIFYDHGAQVPGGLPGTPEEDGDRFTEIWNLVFMQYDQQPSEAGGKQLALPKPCIDTGMGLERMAAVLEGVHDNYETGLFRALMDASKGLSSNADPSMNASHRVIADHLRACSFLLSEGVRPANEGRGYVLRRIMRRAMRHVHLLGVKEPMMHRLVPALVEQMGSAYPELKEQETAIAGSFEQEEQRFRTTLERGLQVLEGALEKVAANKPLPGDVAFTLYDTYGFPLDLTQDIARARNIQVDSKGFDAAMADQRARARAAWSGSGDAGTDATWFEVANALEKTGACPTEFLGYSGLSGCGEIVSLLQDGKEVEKLQAGEEGVVLTNQTPFYGESGGQAGDQGFITGEAQSRFAVHATQKPLGTLIAHHGKVEHGTLSVGDAVQMEVDKARRDSLRANHSATHLLHAALHHRIGSHIVQKGSQVQSDGFRFDFSAEEPLGHNMLKDLEQDINQIIMQNADVHTNVMTPDEAKKAGAMALFGEKYGDQVRVVAMGNAAEGPAYSMELCGGTHVARTGDIGLCVLVRESAVASGVRRIEALTGQPAIAWMQAQRALLHEATSQMKASAKELPERIATLQQEHKQMLQQIGQLKQQVALAGEQGASASQGSPWEEVKGIRFVGKVLPDSSGKELRGLVDEFKKKIESGVVALVGTNGDKAALAVGVTQDLVGQLDAVALVKAGAAALGSKGGGGRPDFAQTGGPNAEGAAQAIEAIKAAF